MRIRTLGTGGRDEREALLELLDGWPFADDRRGRDFFRRYLDLDPDFAPDNVWVAEERDRLVACVQVFPRRLRVQARTVPVGGIGSVFTASEYRRRGLGTRLLEAAIEQMVERGMVLSLLLATRLDWYRRLGFEPWQDERWRLLVGDVRAPSAASGVRVEDFVGQRLEAIRNLGDRYASSRLGTMARSPAQWRASLDLAGDPDEVFTVGQSGGRLVAYLRCAALDGRWQALEWGRELGHPSAAEALSELFLQAVIAGPEQGLGLPPLRDPDLEGALRSRGLLLEREPWRGAGPPPTWMVRCLAPKKLARLFALEVPEDGTEIELLQRVLPREQFCFWPADRF